MLPIYKGDLYPFEGNIAKSTNNIRNAKATIHVIDGIGGSHHGIEQIGEIV